MSSKEKSQQENKSLADIQTNLTKRLGGSFFTRCSPAGSSKQRSSQKILGTGPSATGLKFLVLNQQNKNAYAWQNLMGLLRHGELLTVALLVKSSAKICLYQNSYSIKWTHSLKVFTGIFYLGSSESTSEYHSFFQIKCYYFLLCHLGSHNLAEV